jgi:hypothetical protein
MHTIRLISAMVVLTCCLSNGAMSTRAALVGYWKFEEGTGTVARNQVAGGPDGALLGGATFVPTGLGINSDYSLRLDHATNDLVSFGENYSFPTGPFSVIVWVKLTPGDTTPMYPIAKYVSGTASGYFLALGNVAGGSSAAQPGRPQFVESGFSSEQVSRMMNDGSWHMIVGTYEHVSQTVRVWVDTGTSGGGGPAPAMVTNTAPLLLGGIIDAGVSSNFFTGLVDEVRLYDHALSFSEVSALYASTLPEPLVPALVMMASIGFWRRAPR